MDENDKSVDLDIRFDSDRRIILTQLIEIDLDLSQMYESAINVLGLNNVPKKINLAAHSLRELMAKMPKYISAVPMIRNSADLKTLAMNFKKDWDNFANIQPEFTSLPWDVNSQNVIKNLLNKCKIFSEDSSSILRTKKEISRAVLGKLSDRYSMQPIPAHIEDQMIKTWQSCQEYFIQVAHHKSTTNEIFISYLASFELILRDLLAPPVFDNMKEIMRIIKEGESRAN